MTPPIPRTRAPRILPTTAPAMTDLGVFSPVRSVLSPEEVSSLPVVGGSVGIADGRATPGAVHCGGESAVVGVAEGDVAGFGVGALLGE
jgi:hypothetical protein